MLSWPCASGKNDSWKSSACTYLHVFIFTTHLGMSIGAFFSFFETHCIACVVMNSDEHGMLGKNTRFLTALPFLGSDKLFDLPKLCVFANLDLHFESSDLQNNLLIFGGPFLLPYYFVSQYCNIRRNCLMDGTPEPLLWPWGGVLLPKNVVYIRHSKAAGIKYIQWHVDLCLIRPAFSGNIHCWHS